MSQRTQEGTLHGRSSWINERIQEIADRLKAVEDAGIVRVPKPRPHRDRYGCAHYEADKSVLANAGLMADQYEQEIKAMAKRNGF